MQFDLNSQKQYYEHKIKEIKSTISELQDQQVAYVARGRIILQKNPSDLISELNEQIGDLEARLSVINRQLSKQVPKNES